MPYRTAVFLMLSASLVAAPVGAETVRSTSRLNLRQGPSQSSPRIMVMSADRDLLVLERREEWVRVRVNDTEGWVHADYVTADAVGAGEPPSRAMLAQRLAGLEAELEAARLATQAEVEALRHQLAAATAERDRLAGELKGLHERLVAAAAEEEEESSAVAARAPQAEAAALVRVAEPLAAGAPPPSAGQREAIVAAVRRWAKEVVGIDVADVEITMLKADRARVICSWATGPPDAREPETLEARFSGGTWRVRR